MPRRPPTLPPQQRIPTRRREHTGVRTARRDGRHTGQHITGKRSRAVHRGAVAELALGILAPTTDAAGHRQRAGVTAAGGDGLRTGEHVARRWDGAIRRGAVAELALGIWPQQRTPPAIVNAQV